MKKQQRCYIYRLTGLHTINWYNAPMEVRGCIFTITPTPASAD